MAATATIAPSETSAVPVVGSGSGSAAVATTTHTVGHPKDATTAVSAAVPSKKSIGMLEVEKKKKLPTSSAKRAAKRSAVEVANRIAATPQAHDMVQKHFAEMKRVAAAAAASSSTTTSTSTAISTTASTSTTTSIAASSPSCPIGDNAPGLVSSTNGGSPSSTSSPPTSPIASLTTTTLPVASASASPSSPSSDPSAVSASASTASASTSSSSSSKPRRTAKSSSVPTIDVTSGAPTPMMQSPLLHTQPRAARVIGKLSGATAAMDPSDPLRQQRISDEIHASLRSSGIPMPGAGATGLPLSPSSSSSSGAAGADSAPRRRAPRSDGIGLFEGAAFTMGGGGVPISRSPAAAAVGGASSANGGARGAPRAAVPRGFPAGTMSSPSPSPLSSSSSSTRTETRSSPAVSRRITTNTPKGAKSAESQRRPYGPLTRENAKQIWKHAGWSASGMHVVYQMAVAKALYDEKIFIEENDGCSGGAIAATWYLNADRWYDDASIDDIICILPYGKRRDNANWRQRILAVFRRWCGRRPQKSSSCVRREAKMDPAKYKGDGDNTDRGMDLARDRCLLMIRQLIDRYPDTYKRVDGRLTVVAVSVPCLRLAHLDRFSCNGDLIAAICATSDNPIAAGKGGFVGHRYRGRPYYDGGIKCFHPVRNRHTVVISTTPMSIRWCGCWQPSREACRVKRVRNGVGEIGRDIPPRGAAEILCSDHYRDVHAAGYKDAIKYIRRRERRNKRWCAEDTAATKDKDRAIHTGGATTAEESAGTTTASASAGTSTSGTVSMPAAAVATCLSASRDLNESALEDQDCRDDLSDADGDINTDSSSEEENDDGGRSDDHDDDEDEEDDTAEDKGDKKGKEQRVEGKEEKRE